MRLAASDLLVGPGNSWNRFRIFKESPIGSGLTWDLFGELFFFQKQPNSCRLLGKLVGCAYTNIFNKDNSQLIMPAFYLNQLLISTTGNKNDLLKILHYNQNAPLTTTLALNWGGKGRPRDLLLVEGRRTSDEVSRK